MNVRKMVFDLVGCSFSGVIEEKEARGLYVNYDGTKAVIGADTVPGKARGYMLLAKAIAEGKNALEINQKPAFKTVGPMLDMSRGGVMTVEAVKKYLEYTAALGMNMLMLYTEDTYEVEGYPFFGYQRGRYTLQELQEIDDYAYELGIEVIPCIQTFGHMEQYLRYPFNADIKDNDAVLLAGEEKTYELIRACVATMRKAFRSDRIHIGCDETRGLSLGQYLNKNGYRDRFTVFNEHLHKVTDICREFGYRPMMWSDMYYSLAEKNRAGGYPPHVEVPQYAIDSMPDCDMVFWEYDQMDNDHYRINLAKHRSFNRPVIFAGGIRTWDGFVPYYTHSYATTKPAMEECLRGGVEEVIITLWGNDGTETNYMLGLPLLPMFSEYCWLGEDCTETDIWSVSEFLTGTTKELACGVSDFFMGYGGAIRSGKHILWSDPLINLLYPDYDLEAGMQYLENSLALFENYPNHRYIAYFKAVFTACLDKCRLHAQLRQRYKAEDRVWLKEFAEVSIPQIVADFTALESIHRAVWHADYKTQGFERLQYRYFGAIGRLNYLAEIIKAYLAGEVEKIPELEPEILHSAPIRSRPGREFMYIAAH